ncbi:uncharacterized protein NPIL_220951 [Nephila pilipes]|uniref:DUF7041 domain-containing protein n=2 Tax=Nephila pilipes TaxID=299642 RepID=A0A8X6N8S7_NEPPI|nr:uncharacterized protein NPIL_220951 [Nephila pilipes]
MDENKSDPTALNFDNPNTEINRVAVKPPIFWRNKPKLWFLQLEAQFANSGISQDATKYNIVVAALDENVLDFVVDILSNPPENEKYDTLKKALLNRLTDTEESRLKKLLTDLELGDKRPSDLLRQMKSLAGNSISDEIIKSLWLQRLPQQTQAILTISNDTLDKIAEMADKIIAVYSSSEICQATKVGSLPNSASSFDRNKLDVLQADIAALTKKFDEFSRNTRSRSKSRGNDRRRSRSNSARYEFCTTSYHPQANGCIERWHRTLKASIMCHENESWTRSLRIILLGLRTTWRADFQSTPAELLYGENIRLPCDFFEDTKFQPQSEFVQKLKATMKQVKPIPFSYNCKQKPFVFKDLKNCSHVFVRTDIIRQSLQPPYHGPYQVIKRSDKIFTLLIKNKNVNISIDRLKPCFSDNSPETDCAINHKSNPVDKPTSPVKKKIRFAPLPIAPSTRFTRRGQGLGIRDDPVVHERDQAMEIFKETVEFENGRYIVQLPFRKSYNELSDNYSLAKQRFQGLWRRFGHDSELYQQYREIILDYSEQELLDRSFYVDDLISGGNEFEEALQTSRRAKYVMEAAGMDLRKWITNDTNLMEQWKKENFDVHPVHETVSLGANETKVLGLSWNSHEDYLTTDTKSLLEFVSLDKNTKRFILQAVGKIFDPLGLISPFTVRMKCLLQDLWKEEIQWDDPLPTHIEKEWKKWREELPHLGNSSTTVGISLRWLAP